MNMMDVIIRKGEEGDLERVLELIVELAIFEREPDAVTNSVARMRRDGFGPNAIYEFFVGEVNGKIEGVSIFYYRYSTWKGRCLYLEDLIVTEAARGKGIGTKLFGTTVNHAKINNCVQMNWQVLDWNQTAIDFYNKYGAEIVDGWLNARLDFGGLNT